MLVDCATLFRMPCEPVCPKIELMNLFCRMSFLRNQFNFTHGELTTDVDLVNSTELQELVARARQLTSSPDICNLNVSEYQHVVFLIDEYDYSHHPAFNLSF